ncbi:hypothetical protein JTE90_021723 [Oedothorax gibbosus]|uniref:Uncharacterized protein n=1 Tax=Oedothorax gibbosus TaxID=931172 RepID=A0AAV6UG90_9ARAC|nr:hypothetical protein JTE90_021723 [Oedothorax gibbosus]
MARDGPGTPHYICDFTNAPYPKSVLFVYSIDSYQARKYHSRFTPLIQRPVTLCNYSNRCKTGQWDLSLGPDQIATIAIQRYSQVSSGQLFVYDIMTKVPEN